MKFTTVAALAALGATSVVAEEAKMDRLMKLKLDSWDRARQDGMFGGSKLYKKFAGFKPCRNGMSGEYQCNNVDMRGFLSHEDLGSQSMEGNDLWGWTSATGREFGIVGETDGVGFVELNTFTGSLTYIGRLPTQTPDNILAWRDIKVIGDYAYIGAESRHGIQIFDLKKLLTVRRFSRFNPFFKPKVFSIEKDITHYDGLESTHNLVADHERQIIYGVGGQFGPNSRSSPCRAGLFAVDVSDPTNPTSPGCVALDGYVHDAQCVVYQGPSTKYNGKNICFGYNEDTLTIYDLTDLQNPEIISKTPYVGAAYTHQGWLTSQTNMKWLLLDDELDELDGVGPSAENGRTTTYLFNIADLENPINTGFYQSPAISIDHNQYVVNGLSYQSNYGSGLRIVDVSGLDEDPEGGNMEQTGFFDCHPEDDDTNGVIEFLGSWSVYPYFRSGYILLNSIERGVFSLKYTGRGAKF